MANQNPARLRIKSLKKLRSVGLKEVAMILDPKYFPALVNPINYEVFNVVAQARKIPRKDLWEAVHEPEEEVSQSLNELQKAGLIKKEPASLEDFSVYYVTGEGLIAERLIRRLNPTMFSNWSTQVGRRVPRQAKQASSRRSKGTSGGVR
jgi:predicted transcriptional regulator